MEINVKIFRKFPKLITYKNTFLQKTILIFLKSQFLLYFQIKDYHKLKKKSFFYLINRLTINHFNFNKISFLFERFYRLIFLLLFFFKKLYNMFKKCKKYGLNKKILEFSDHYKKKFFFCKIFCAQIIYIETLKKFNKKNLIKNSITFRDKMDFLYHINFILKRITNIFFIKKHWITTWSKNLFFIKNQLHKLKDLDFKKSFQNKYRIYFKNFPGQKLDKKIFFSKKLPINISSAQKFHNFEIEPKHMIAVKRHPYFLFKNISRFFKDKTQSNYRIMPKKFFVTNKKTDLFFLNLEMLGIIYYSNIYYGPIVLKKKFLLKFNRFQPFHGSPVLHIISYMTLYMFSKFLYKMFEKSINMLNFIVFSFTTDLNLFKNLKSIIFSQITYFSNWFRFPKQTCVEIFINEIENIMPNKIINNLTKKKFSKKYYKMRIEIKLKIKLLSFFFFYSGTLLYVFNQNLFFGLKITKIIIIFENLKKNILLASKIKLILQLAPMIFLSVSIGLKEKIFFLIIFLRKIKNKNFRYILLFVSKILSLAKKNLKKVWEILFKTLMEFGAKKIDKTIQRKYYRSMNCFKETIDEIALTICYSNHYLYYEEEKTDTRKNIIFIEKITSNKIEVEMNLKTDYLNNLLTGFNFFSIKRNYTKLQLVSMFRFLLFNTVLNYNKSIISSLAFLEVFEAYSEHIDILYRNSKKIKSTSTHLFSMTIIGLGSSDNRIRFLFKYAVDLIFKKKKVFIKPIRFRSFKCGDFFPESTSNKFDDFNNNFPHYTKIVNFRIKNNDILFIRLSQGLLFLNIAKSFRYFEENDKKINYKNFGIFVNGAFLFIAKNLGGVGIFPISIFLLGIMIKNKRKGIGKKCNSKTFILKNK